MHHNCSSYGKAKLPCPHSGTSGRYLFPTLQPLSRQWRMTPKVLRSCTTWFLIPTLPNSTAWWDKCAQTSSGSLHGVCTANSNLQSLDYRPDTLLIKHNVTLRLGTESYSRLKWEFVTKLQLTWIWWHHHKYAQAYISWHCSHNPINSTRSVKLNTDSPLKRTFFCCQC